MNANKSLFELKEWKLARVVKPIPSRFSRWKIGETVKARRTGRKMYVIEKVKWGAQKVPLVNQCAGVPSECLEISEK